MTINDLPDYVEGGGRNQIWRPPYHATKAELLGLVLKADRAAIDKLLKRHLNDPAGGAVDYRCAHRNIIVTLAKIEKLSSTDPPDSRRGHIAEHELSIWCLAADKTAEERLVWYLPYVFTDSGQTVCTGREVYGYPKQIGTFDAGFPTIFKRPGETTVKALAIDPYAESSEAVLQPMVLVKRKAGRRATPAPSGSTWAQELTDNLYPGGFSIDPDAEVWVSPKPRLSATITVGTSPRPPRLAPLPGFFRPIIRALVGAPLSKSPDALAAELVKSPTLVFLKQFRDIRCPTKACYQAITEAPISIDPLGATFDALDPSRFDVTVRNWASHPIATELGLTKDVAQAPDRVFRADLNFDIMTGLEVWRAST